jgi:hypothetical protein
MYNESPPKYHNNETFDEGVGSEEPKTQPNPPLGASVLLKGLTEKMKKFFFQRQ